MIVRLLLAALAAGLIAGMAMTPAQYLKTIPLIMQAEAYENGEVPHSHGETENAVAAPAAEAYGHSHGAESHTDDSMLGFGRFWDTVLANLVAGAGFALMLAAAALLTGIGFPEGREGVTRGLLLGAAAWFCVQLAPSMSLPPAVPGFPYADLGDRQGWWMITVAASAVGLWCIAMRPEWLVKVVGVVLIVAPHVWGSPVPEDLSSEVPAYLASAYAAASLATTLFFWLLLGGLLGSFLSRVPEEQTA
ncbi:cobalt transporter subunit CbtA [Hoeflea sp. IMCC20628]|uniref:CbtA family protein n=1 Tax=Hoeflea sp. IMCC20628 TaxID=1620421 RepID=UPI00063AE99D|nr:CbtA family protein [Hoeflea sp. IMCC20628]AKH99763.1 cobalt transporter subunit CbtA [Hoeflea sp. IMCC20628]